MSNNTITKDEFEQTITTIERNGKTFMFIEHFSDEQTYEDIIKNDI